MKTRAAIIATVLSAGVAGSAAGFAAHRAAPALPPSAASTSVGQATMPTYAPATPTTPMVPSGVPTTTAEPITPTGAARPTPTTTPTTATPTYSAEPVYSPAWDLSSLLTTAELTRAGLPGKPSSSSRFSGFGQATMGNCEPGLTTQEGARAFFRADTYYDQPKDQAGYASQMTARFPSSTLARKAAQHIEAQRTDCAAPWNGPAGPWTSTPVRRSTIGGASVTTWTTTPPNGAGFETIVVVRSRSFVSVVLVSGTNSWRDRIKAGSLAASSAARLP